MIGLRQIHGYKKNTIPIFFSYFSIKPYVVGTH